MISCSRFRHRLSEFLDGRVDPTDHAEIESHAAACSACRTEKQRLEKADSFARSLARPAPPPGLTARIVERTLMDAASPSMAAAPRPAPARTADVFYRAAVLALLVSLNVILFLRAGEPPAPLASAPLASAPLEGLSNAAGLSGSSAAGTARSTRFEPVYETLERSNALLQTMEVVRLATAAEDPDERLRPILARQIGEVGQVLRETRTVAESDPALQEIGVEGVLDQITVFVRDLEGRIEAGPGVDSARRERLTDILSASTMRRNAEEIRRRTEELGQAFERLILVPPGDRPLRLRMRWGASARADESSDGLSMRPFHWPNRGWPQQDDAQDDAGDEGAEDARIVFLSARVDDTLLDPRAGELLRPWMVYVSKAGHAGHYEFSSEEVEGTRRFIENLRLGEEGPVFRLEYKISNED